MENLPKLFCKALRGFSCCANQENLLSDLHRILVVRTVFLSSILGILMTYLCGALVLASSICWLMSQLASIMFFLLHLLIITLAFCPSEPLLMMLYFVQHDRLLIRYLPCLKPDVTYQCEQNHSLLTRKVHRVPSIDGLWTYTLHTSCMSTKTASYSLSVIHFETKFWAVMLRSPELSFCMCSAHKQTFKRTSYFGDFHVFQ